MSPLCGSISLETHRFIYLFFLFLAFILNWFCFIITYMKATSPLQNSKIKEVSPLSSLWVFPNLFPAPLYRSSLFLHAFSPSVSPSSALFPSPSLSIDPFFNFLNNFSLLFNLTSFQSPEFHWCLDLLGNLKYISHQLGDLKHISHQQFRVFLPWMFSQLPFTSSFLYFLISLLSIFFALILLCLIICLLSFWYNFEIGWMHLVYYFI